MKLDPHPTIVVAGYRALIGVNMGTLTVCVTDAQSSFPPRHVAAGHEYAGAWRSPVFRRGGGP